MSPSKQGAEERGFIFPLESGRGLGKGRGGMPLEPLWRFQGVRREDCRGKSRKRGVRG